MTTDRASASKQANGRTTNPTQNPMELNTHLFGVKAASKRLALRQGPVYILRELILIKLGACFPCRSYKK